MKERDYLADSIAWGVSLVFLGALWIGSAYLWNVRPPVPLTDGIAAAIIPASVVGGIATAVGLFWLTYTAISVSLAVFFDERMRPHVREVRFDHQHKKAG